MRKMRFLLGVMLVLAATSATAQLSIEITGAGAQRTPIAIVPFAGEATTGANLTAIVRADLERSGLFRGLELPPLSPHPNENSPVNYGEWRSRLADAMPMSIPHDVKQPLSMRGSPNHISLMRYVVNIVVITY